MNRIYQLISKPIYNQRLHITTVTSTTINILEISKAYLITEVDIFYYKFYKYLYFTRVFLLWKTYYYHTFTFHKIISFLLFLSWRNCHPLSDWLRELVFITNLLNRFTNHTEWFIPELDWFDCSCSWVNNSLIQWSSLSQSSCLNQNVAK